MVSNSSECRLEMAQKEPRGALEKGKVKMENGEIQRRLEMGEEGSSKWESGEEARAGIRLRVRSVRVNVDQPVPRPVGMQRPQRG